MQQKGLGNVFRRMLSARKRCSGTWFATPHSCKPPAAVGAQTKCDSGESAGAAGVLGLKPSPCGPPRQGATFFGATRLRRTFIGPPPTAMRHWVCDRCAFGGNGWGGRGRTYNLRSQSPSLCQLSYAPKERPGAGEAKGQTRRYCDLRVSASSTADACAPCANRLSYARPCGRHGSETRRGAATNAYSRHIRPAHGQCRGGLHRPDQWYHHR